MSTEWGGDQINFPLGLLNCCENTNSGIFNMMINLLTSMPSTETMKKYLIEGFNNFESFLENLTWVQETGFIFLIVSVTLLFYSMIYSLIKMHNASGLKARSIDLHYALLIYIYKIVSYLYTIGILLIIVEVVLNKYPQIDFYNHYLHYGAILSILIILMAFNILSIYFYLLSPVQWLCKKRFPRLKFSIMGIISLPYYIYDIVSIIGVSGKGNSISYIYDILYQFFNIEITTIPKFGNSIILSYVSLSITFVVALLLANRITFKLEMWGQGESQIIPYLFIITAAFSLIFIFQLIFEDVTLQIYELSISCIVIMDLIIISGWFYGISKMGKRNREKIQSAWDCVRVSAIEGGKITGEEAASISSKVAKNPECYNQVVAIEHLLKFGLQEGTELALNALGDEKNLNEFDRGQVALALGKYKCTVATEPLISLLKDKDDDLRSDVAEALGKMGDERAITPLIIGLNDNQINVQIAVAGALGELGDKRGLDLLLFAVNNDNPDVRCFAVNTLGVFQDKRAQAVLRQAVKDKNKDVSEQAKLVLEEMRIKGN